MRWRAYPIREFDRLTLNGTRSTPRPAVAVPALGVRPGAPGIWNGKQMLATYAGAWHCAMAMVKRAPRDVGDVPARNYRSARLLQQLWRASSGLLRVLLGLAVAVATQQDPAVVARPPDSCSSKRSTISKRPL
jgi:hypothetical protein